MKFEKNHYDSNFTLESRVDSHEMSHFALKLTFSKNCEFWLKNGTFLRKMTLFWNFWIERAFWQLKCGLVLDLSWSDRLEMVCCTNYFSHFCVRILFGDGKTQVHLGQQSESGIYLHKTDLRGQYCPLDCPHISQVKGRLADRPSRYYRFSLILRFSFFRISLNWQDGNRNKLLFCLTNFMLLIFLENAVLIQI